MDQIKIGKFIAELRRDANLTQEELGEKLGVTNKTISRWENENYMPDIEMLQLLAKTFHISLNELLSGEKLNETAFKEKADENLLEVAKERTFTLEEEKQYLKKKWRKDHIWDFVVIILATIGLYVLFYFVKPELCSITCFLFFFSIIDDRNRMQAYIENHIYGKKK